MQNEINIAIGAGAAFICELHALETVEEAQKVIADSKDITTLLETSKKACLSGLLTTSKQRAYNVLKSMALILQVFSTEDLTQETFEDWKTAVTALVAAFEERIGQ